MCRYFSYVITRDLKVHWLKNTMEHLEILESIKQEDKKLNGRDFVQGEITLKDETKVSRSREDWQLTEDEPSTIPEWYKDNLLQARENAWLAWEESIKINLVINNEKVEVTNTYLLMFGSSEAVMHDSSKAKMYDSSKAVMYDSSEAVMYDSSKAEMHDSSKAEMHDSSEAKMYDSSKAEMYDSSKAEMYGSSKALIKSTLAIAIKDGVIHVHADAEVKRTLAV